MFALMLVLSSASTSVEAGVVRSANSVTQTAGAAGEGINALINQSGLEERTTLCPSGNLSCNVLGVAGGNPLPYTSGVTDWTTYFAAFPTHTAEKQVGSSPVTYFEWWSGTFTSSASLLFDFGTDTLLSGIAIWNEDAVGVSTFNLRDGNGNLLLSGQSLTDNPSFPQANPYRADLFTFTAVQTRYLTLELTACNYQNSLFGNRCSLGEVAFRQELASVPAPAAVMMLGWWIVLLGAVRALPRAGGR